MKPNRKSLFSLLLIVPLFAHGCLYTRSYASIQHIYPNTTGAKERVILTVGKATNKPTLAHVAVVNVVEYYEFTLPVFPVTNTIIEAHNLSVTVYNEKVTGGVPHFIGGTITVYPSSRMLIISLTTDKGVFRGNGRYPLDGY
jgi:hypothetical protein